jgi:riboflavin kinase
MIKGEVFTGEGEASGFLSLQPYMDFISEKAGFDPYPGTLNVRSTEKAAEKIRQTAPSYSMEPVEYDGSELGGLNLYLVEVKGEKCGIVQPELTRYGDQVLEIVAPFNLREKYELEDGDRLRIETFNRQ